jgi:hypothetical protein
MGAPPPHEMVHQGTDVSGMEEWRCPECGRHFVVRWPPDFERLVLAEGDGDAVHVGAKDAPGLTGVQVTPAGDAEADAEAEWRGWLRDNGIDWDGQVA